MATRESFRYYAYSEVMGRPDGWRVNKVLSESHVRL